jgi:hypothetical protein
MTFHFNYIVIACLSTVSLIHAQPTISFAAADVAITNINQKEYCEIPVCFFDKGLVLAANYKHKGEPFAASPKKEYLYELYYYKRASDSRFDAAEYFLGMNKVTDLLDEGCFTFDEKHTCMISVLEIVDRKDLILRGVHTHLKQSIYQGTYTESGIGNMNKLNFCDKRYNYGWPNLSGDGNKLVFVSDLQGNMDIYSSEQKANGTWSAPEPIIAVNTDNTETMPYLVNDSLLFFASNGLGGFGGFDLFYSIKSDTGWSRPVKLGQPVNSNKNELRIVMHPSLEYGYFSSERSDAGDVYFIRRKINE